MRSSVAFACLSSLAVLAEGALLRSRAISGSHAAGSFPSIDQDVKKLAMEEWEVEANRPPPSRLGFIVHRKTGYMMSFFVSKCFDPEYNDVQRLMDPAIDSPNFVHGSKDAVYAHLARDPLDLVVSNYLYNKFTSKEPHTRMRGTAEKHVGRCKRISKEAYSKLPEVEGRETMRHYLHRVSNHSGLLVTACESHPIVASMVRISDWCKAHEDRCTQVYIDRLMKSSQSFMSTMKSIASMAGYEWTAELKHCISFQDVNSPKFGTTGSSHDEHCSRFRVTHAERDAIREELSKIDITFMEGYFANSTKLLHSH